MSGTGLAARIAELSALLDGTDIAELSWSDGAETLTIRRDPAPQHQAVAPAEPAADAGVVRAPCPGILRLCHPVREAPLVAAGQAVAAGEVLGLLQIGPLLVPVPATAPGIVAVLAPEAALVGYGTPLFRLQPIASGGDA